MKFINLIENKQDKKMKILISENQFKKLAEKIMLLMEQDKNKNSYKTQLKPDAKSKK